MAKTLEEAFENIEKIDQIEGRSFALEAACAVILDALPQSKDDAYYEDMHQKALAILEPQQQHRAEEFRAGAEATLSRVFRRPD